MQNKADNKIYAGFFVRLAAYLVDLLIVGTALLVIKIPIWISAFASPDNIVVRDIIFSYSIKDIVLYLLKVAYFVILTYYTGSTLGKKLFHIKVVSTEERKLTLFEVVFRESVGRFLASVIIYIGYIMAGIDKEKRGLHDMLSDTNVIYYHEKKVYVQPNVHYQTINYGQPMPQEPSMHPMNDQPMPQGPSMYPMNDQPMPQEPSMHPMNDQPMPQEPSMHPMNDKPMPQGPSMHPINGQPMSQNPSMHPINDQTISYENNENMDVSGNMDNIDCSMTEKSETITNENE